MTLGRAFALAPGAPPCLAPAALGSRPQERLRGLGSASQGAATHRPACAAAAVAGAAAWLGSRRVSRRVSRRRRCSAIRRHATGREVLSRGSQAFKLPAEGTNPDLDMLVKGLRGGNLNDQDMQEEGLDMYLVDITSRDEETGLPL
ncbi:unnamed protein product, partial [Polarella glacialis]